MKYYYVRAKFLLNVIIILIFIRFLSYDYTIYFFFFRSHGLSLSCRGQQILKSRPRLVVRFLNNLFFFFFYTRQGLVNFEHKTIPINRLYNCQRTENLRKMMVSSVMNVDDKHRSAVVAHGFKMSLFLVIDFY